MRKPFIVLPSVDGAEYDLYVLPPLDLYGDYMPLDDALTFVNMTIANVQKELGEDVDGEAAKKILAQLEARGFLVLEPSFANENYDRGVIKK